MDINNGATEIRTGEIIKEFVRLNESKEQLHSRIEVLGGRLKDILGPSAPSPVDETCPPKQQLSSPMAIDLSAISSTIEADLRNINDLLERLEI